MPLFSHRKAIRKVRQIGAPNKEPEKRKRPRKIGKREALAESKGYMDYEELKMKEAERSIALRNYIREHKDEDRDYRCEPCGGLRLDTHNRARHLDEHYIKGEITFEELIKYKKPNKNQKMLNKIKALKNDIEQKWLLLKNTK